jgi:hypothetical protein
MTRAWALIEQGRRGEGIEQMRRGFAAYQATGTELMTPYFGSLLAEALDAAAIRRFPDSRRHFEMTFHM